MPILTDNHTQARTGRLFRFWVTYDHLSEDEVFFSGAISEPSRGPFGRLERGVSFEGTVPAGAGSVPIELAIRSRAMSYIDQTDFGDWKPPVATWPGWYGPYL